MRRSAARSRAGALYCALPECQAAASAVAAFRTTALMPSQPLTQPG